MVWMWAIDSVRPPPGAVVLWTHGYELLATYTVYVLAGAYAATLRFAAQRNANDRARLISLSQRLSARNRFPPIGVP